MIILFQILFFFLVFLVFHTYVLFPFLLFILTKNKTLDFNQSIEKKEVTIIMSLYNEESVIAEKIDSILNSDYPLDKIKIIIGSDNSKDKTNEIVETYAKKYNNIDFKAFDKRQGKSNVINAMIDKSNSEILILSDANVFFDKNTISELLRPFSDPKVGLVDSHMKNTGLKKEGISIQEKSYISREVYIKHRESILWGSMMGPFGGCFAIRRELYSPVPKTFLVDDFYLCMKVLEKGYKAVNNIQAVVYEDVSNNLSDEFRRKVRIATGNFQNLKEFKHLLWPVWKGLGFSFLSHKVLRWITPIFLILAWAINFYLAFYSKFYLIFFCLYNFILLLPILDFLLKKINIHNVFLRFITHFITMNIALFTGMFKAMKGVKSNVWKPTKRNQ
ncbi:MAG: glycosyltransferase [Bacteroidales bacterium]|jgi:cellulose synthase/poly-beta-1,6-N-acetylglucosamine synthase-like glycosyltransferase|nr:glycosyltransferase [Bacteroidales bacterium]MCK9499682.1 glycosyltransferase [Bacteroidales bacterium]MDY0315921.1 glycosyltransferase [Bacteroidales bacterium]NLB85658.1 glycosyltransferase [Bacteroidales bacterium]